VRDVFAPNVPDVPIGQSDAARAISNRFSIPYIHTSIASESPTVNALVSVAYNSNMDQ
jgi:hypothetical protein